MYTKHVLTVMTSTQSDIVASQHHVQCCSAMTSLRVDVIVLQTSLTFPIWGHCTQWGGLFPGGQLASRRGIPSKIGGFPAPCGKGAWQPYTQCHCCNRIYTELPQLSDTIDTRSEIHPHELKAINVPSRSFSVVVSWLKNGHLQQKPSDPIAVCILPDRCTLLVY